MAIAKDGLLGGFSGKVGNVVGLQLNGKNIMRAAPKTSKRPPTEKQKIQRLKFALAVEFTKPFLFVTQQFFNHNVFSGERRNLVIAYTLQNVIALQDGEWHIEWSKFLVSNGDLAGFHQLEFEVIGEELFINWKDNCNQAFAHQEDEVHLVMASEKLLHIEYLEKIAFRNTLQTRVELPTWAKKETAHLYVFISNTNKTKSCNSFYLGRISAEVS